MKQLATMDDIDIINSMLSTVRQRLDILEYTVQDLQRLIESRHDTSVSIGTSSYNPGRYITSREWISTGLWETVPENNFTINNDGTITYTTSNT